MGLYYRHTNSQWQREEQKCRYIRERCKSNSVIVVGDFNVPNIDEDLLSAKAVDRVEFVRCIPEVLLKQYLDHAYKPV